jgi:hypothetical protein
MPGLCSEYDPLIQVFLGSPHVPATVFWKGLFLVNGHLTMRFTELLCGHSDLDVGSYSLCSDFQIVSSMEANRQDMWM